MLITIPRVLDGETVAAIVQQLAEVEWSDGRGSAGYLSQQVKRNQQLPDSHPVGLKLAELILNALDDNALFNAAALPRKFVPPLFNRYRDGGYYGRHIDGAIRPVSGTALRVRTDLSATIFLTPPLDYDGGELVIEDTFGPRPIKLEAGDMVLYSGSSVHRVEPVTRGTRHASFFWIESMVREDAKRSILFELDQSIQKLATTQAETPAVINLAGVYHNLLRLWSDA